MSQNWTKIRGDFIDEVKCGFYIDKTEDLESFQRPGTYMHRMPRGFGKTTLLATMGCFYGMSLEKHEDGYGKEGKRYLNNVFGEDAAKNFEICRKRAAVNALFGTFVPVYFRFPRAGPNYMKLFLESIEDLVAQFEMGEDYVEFFKNVCDEVPSGLNRVRRILLSLFLSLNCEHKGKIILLVDDTEQPFHAKKLNREEVFEGKELLEVFLETEKMDCVQYVILTSAELYVPKQRGDWRICRRKLSLLG